MPETTKKPTLDQEQVETVYREARALFRGNPDWVSFYRKVLGLGGLARRTFRTPEALAEFERTETYSEILEMVARLRERRADDEDPQEPTRVITVRLPRSVHEALRTEAYEHQTSMNKLCISKLLQFIEDELVPRPS